MILILLLAGCGTIAPKPQDSGKISVVATVFAPYDFTRAIAGDLVDLTMLLPPAAESHSFEPTPRDITKIQQCDVFLYVGGDSDAWVGSILESFDTSKMKIITLMDCVEAVPEELLPGMEEEEEAEEEGEAELDEHVWTSPRNAKLIVQKIADALCAADAANANAYRQNTQTYLAQLDALDAKFQAVADTAVRKTVVFGDRFPFRYFADAYGLECFAAFPGCSTETEPSANTVKFLIDKIKSEKLPVVFHIELSNEAMADTIAEATGAKVLLLHACHNITLADFNAGRTYLDIMNDNVTALKEALN
ncbi:MAG: metal ABC transporter substrate-binding protein [Oscillospiraceae bacterium]|jgi:zinc transport system substrate-binding protein|nr:metal ABC transporter substrate-binding protein [Oscillospiraceae bacterium]